MLEINKCVDDDDFGDLYLDVGMKAASALPGEEKEEEKLDSPEPQEFSDSESEDGLNIVLNDDDVEGKSFHGNFEVNSDDFGYENDEVDGMENDEDAGCGAQVKLTSCVKSNVPAKAPGFSSEQTRGPGFSSGSTDTQRWCNFTLPRHRTILDFNSDALEWKPWRLPGADITDYFNFGLNEESWKSYCNHLNICRGKRSDVNGYPAYNPSRHTKEVGSEHKLLAEVATEINTQFIGILPPFHPKGKAIEVKEGTGERQPSNGVWHPVDRGTGDAIQIPLQDSEEDHPTSAKGAVDGKSSYIQESSDIKEFGDVAQSEGGIAVCFGSPSEGRLPCIDSVSMLSVDCESLQGSEADGYDKLDTLESYSDGSSEANRSSSDPEEDAGGIKPPTATLRKDLETIDAEPKFYSPNPSSSRSYDSASGYDAYVEADRIHGLSKNDTVKRVYHSTKDSERLGIRRNSGRSENFPRSRSPIRRNHTFHRSRSSRSRSPIRRNHAFHRSRHSRSKSPFRRGNKFYQERSSRMAGLKSYPDNQDACYVSGSDEFHEIPHRASGRFTEKSRHQGFNHSEREDFWHDKGSGDFFYRGVKRCKDRLSVEEMESIHYDYMGEFITEQLPIPDYRKHTPRNGKLEEMHLTRRGDIKFTCGRVYKNDYSRENYVGKREAMDHQYDRLLSYPQREGDYPTDSSRKFDRVYENIRSQDWEDHKVRHSGNPFPPSSVRYQNDGRASFSRGDEFGREDGQMQDRCFERFSGSKLCGWDAAAFHDDENVEHIDYRDDIEQYDDQDSFSGNRQCLESEELHEREERYSSWLRDSDFQVNGTLNPVKKSLRGKRFGFVHNHEGKLICYDYRQNRCKRLRKGNNDSQFLQNSKFTQTVIVDQTISGNWKSTDTHMVVGNRKSSRCFDGRGFMSNARYEYSDRTVQPGQRISMDSNISHVENTARADDDRSKTFKDSKKEDSSDIEEGQIVVNDFDEEHKKTPCKNPRILEMIAKMEKRQQRFKQPLVPVSEKNDCPSTDKVATTMASNTKAKRPARKRKWIAS